MIEVSLYSIPQGSDTNVTMGRCVDRARFDKDTLKVSVMEFVKDFLKTNASSIEPAVKNKEIISFINEDGIMTTKDFACINYWLAKSGYLVKIWNVTEDEDNPTGPSGETSEWNVIDYNFIQYDYPTTVKILPSDGMDVVEVLKQATNDIGIFDNSKFRGMANPVKDLVGQLEAAKIAMGNISSAIAGRIYDILDQVGIKIFLATSSD